MKVDLTPYRRHIREELTPDKKERGKYACPICGSGTRSGRGSGQGRRAYQMVGIRSCQMIMMPGAENEVLTGALKGGMIFSGL